MPLGKDANKISWNTCFGKEIHCSKNPAFPVVYSLTITFACDMETGLNNTPFLLSSFKENKGLVAVNVNHILNLKKSFLVVNNKKKKKTLSSQ